MVTRRDFLRYGGAVSVPLLGAGCTIGGSAADAPALDEAVARQVPQADSRPPRPSGGNEMNAIVVVIDSLRRDHVGAYGGTKAQTPTLDALAAEGTMFANAYPEAMPSMQVRRAIHTGRRTYPFHDWVPQQGVGVFLEGWQRVPEDQVTLAEVLQEVGYTTAFFTDNPWMFQPSMNFHRGFDVYDRVRGQAGDPWRSPRLADEDAVARVLPDALRDTGIEPLIRQYVAQTAGRRGEEDYFAPAVFRMASEWLRQAAEQQPFLLVVDVYDPHEPWDPPPDYTRRYDDSDYRGIEPIQPLIGGVADYLDERLIQRSQALYAGEVTLVDHWLGKFLDDLDGTGLADDTLLIVFSDHGVFVGDRNLIGKPRDNSLWPEIIDIPFLVRHPEYGRGRTVDGFVSTHDITPTVLGALDVRLDAEVDGRDATPLLEGDETAARTHLTSAYGEHVWVRRGDDVLAVRVDRTDPKLFDVAADPGQERNLAEDDPDLVGELYELAEQDAGGELPHYDIEQLEQVFDWA